MNFGIGVGDVIALAQLAIAVRRQFVDAPSQFKAISDEVTSLSNILRDIEVYLPERNLTDQQNLDLQQYTEGCRNLLNELHNLLTKYRRLEESSDGFREKARKMWKRLDWEPKDIGELRSRITSTVSVLNTFLTGVNSQVSQATKEGVDRLNKRHEDLEYREILDWLSPTDFSTQQADLIRRRQEGTGQWLLNSKEFVTWLGDTGKTFFCPGIPGAGKTMIASIVIDYLWRTFKADESIGIGYIYYSYKTQHNQSCENSMANILKQLVQGQSTLCDKVKSLYKSHYRSKTRPSIAETKDTIRSVMNKYSKVYFVVDALDECKNEERKNFLNEVFCLQAETGLNFLTTSRDFPEIRVALKDVMILEIRASDEDVLAYVEGQIATLPNCVLTDPALQEEVKDKIVEVVDGMFLLARLHLDSLKSKRRPKAMRSALQQLSNGSNALSDAYKEAIERIESQGEDDKELAKQVFSWLTCSKRLLYTEELRHALAVEVGTSELDMEYAPPIEDIITVCAGLVTVDQDSDIIRLVHYTTQEYLEKIRSSWLPEAQTYIAQVCLTYLSFDVFADFFFNAFDYQQGTRQNALYQYAAQNWANHARVGAEQAIYDSAYHFFQKEAQFFSLGAFLTLNIGASFPPINYNDKIHYCAFFELKDLLNRVLIDMKLEADSKDIYNRTPLQVAALKGCKTVAQFLIERNDVDINNKDYANRTPLIEAARQGHTEIVQLLLSSVNIDVNVKDYEHQSPIWHAASKGHEAVVKLLIGRSDIEVDTNDEDGITPLAVAVQNNQEAVARLLILRDDVNPNSKDIWDRTPLSYAARNGNIVLVQSLAERPNIQIDCEDKYGRTPLSYAVENGKTAVVQLLLNRVDVHADSKDIDDRTPLSYAAEHRNEIILRTLAERADVKADSRDIDGRTPLLYAAKSGNEAMFRFLAERADVNPDSKDLGGRTPLSYAIEYKNEAIVRLLAERADVNPNSKDIRGRTLLSYALECGNEDVVNLLAAKINPRIANLDERSHEPQIT